MGNQKPEARAFIREEIGETCAPTSSLAAKPTSAAKLSFTVTIVSPSQNQEAFHCGVGEAAHAVRLEVGAPTVAQFPGDAPASARTMMMREKLAEATAIASHPAGKDAAGNFNGRIGQNRRAAASRGEMMAWQIAAVSRKAPSIFHLSDALRGNPAASAIAPMRPPSTIDAFRDKERIPG